MRLTALAALVACPFIACYCTLSMATAAEPELKVRASTQLVGPCQGKCERTKVTNTPTAAK
ncbi:MAG: hypothetical protein QM765_37350 [Myxococcales bacterium]